MSTEPSISEDDCVVCGPVPAADRAASWWAARTF
jgi:hypothetical protein